MTWVLAKANRESMNVEGGFQHILTDLYAFIGTLILSVIVMVTGFNRADAIAWLVVAALMMRWATCCNARPSACCSRARRRA